LIPGATLAGPIASNDETRTRLGESDKKLLPNPHIGELNGVEPQKRAERKAAAD
jgi:hypothetical protein